MLQHVAVIPWADILPVAWNSWGTTTSVTGYLESCQCQQFWWYSNRPRGQSPQTGLGWTNQHDTPGNLAKLLFIHSHTIHMLQTHQPLVCSSCFCPPSPLYSPLSTLVSTFPKPPLTCSFCFFSDVSPALPPSPALLPMDTLSSLEAPPRACRGAQHLRNNFNFFA